jgi:hypothetical protein
MKAALSSRFGGAPIAVPGGQSNIEACSLKGRSSRVA